MATIKDYNKPVVDDRANLLQGTNYVSQTFTTSSAYDLDSLIIKAGWYNATSKNGTFHVEIKAVDGNGKPTGAALASSTKPVYHFTGSSVRSFATGATTRLLNYTISFDSPASLSTSTVYAMVFYITGSDAAIFLAGNDESGYASGQLWKSTNSGTVWTERASNDLYFATYTKYDLQLNYESGSGILRSLGGVYWGGTTFTPTSDFILKSLELKVKRVGSDIGAAVIGIREVDVNSKPTGNDLTVGTIYSGDIPTIAEDWREATFDIPYKLDSGTKYAIVIHTTTSTFPGLYVTRTTTDYAGGDEVYSENSGSSWTVVDDHDLWFRLRGSEIGVEGITPESDATSTKKLIAIGGSEFWYVDNNGDWVVLSGSEGDIDSTKPLTAVEAYGKIFIANGSNLKVADFANVKITTTTIGTHPPDFGTILTGSTSGGVMVVDYVDSLAGAMTIYGRRISGYPFQAEIVTGVDDDGNGISFTGTAEVLGPHWYDWTVFGNSSTFGSMPDHATLVSLYNGRLVLAGSKDYSHEWWMSRVYAPFDFLYSAGDNLTAITSGSTEAGEIGDIITSLISYGDDFFVFGCVSSVYLLDGDPTYGGTIEGLTDSEGIYGARSWCKDNQSNLYFFSGDGLYKASGGRGKPYSISETRLPNWFKAWELNSTHYRVVLTFDPINNGIIVSHSSLTDGTNKNYWYDIKIEERVIGQRAVPGGFYPENYPEDCSIFSSYFYNATDASKRKLLLGCNDGYIRSFDAEQLDDEGTSSDFTINSWAVFPIYSFSELFDSKGMLMDITFIVGRNITISSTLDANGDPVDTETSAGSLDWEVYVGNDAETVLNNMKTEQNSFSSGTLSISGRSHKKRPRARGHVFGLRVSNFNSDETWAINSVLGTIKELPGVAY